MRTLKQTMKQVMIGAVAVLALGTSATVAADPPWARGGHHGYERGHGHRHHHHRRHYRTYAPPVVEHHYYPMEARVVYVPPPRVVYAQPVVEYAAPAYPQYGPQYGYGPHGNRVLSSAVLGAAGGFLGSQVGHGDQRAAATAAGAVAGWVLGGNLGY